MRKANDSGHGPAASTSCTGADDPRLTHNHALDYAVAMARHYKKPLVVYEGLKLNPPWVSARFHQFMLEGMAENHATAKAMA